MAEEALSKIRPRTRTASTSTVETARGTHAFKVDGYSLHRSVVGVGRFISSATFAVGGYSWSLRFYPDGWNNRADYVAVFLKLMSPDVAEVMARFGFRLVDHATGQSTVVADLPDPMAFASGPDDRSKKSAFSGWGAGSLMKRSELEASRFLRDDCLVIECDVTVILGKPRVRETAISPGFELQVPPSNLSENLGRLLEEKRGADVTFMVRGEAFPAHRIVLAARSPVFSAELFGPMSESTRQSIAIEDMHPDVFRALLHFVYTDAMPSMEELEGVNGSDDGRKEMVRHLLVAADRYAMERLKLMCEASLCESIDVESVATMAALADQHGCEALGHACAEFVASSNKVGNVVMASQGYKYLKNACPAVLVDLLERVTKCITQTCST